MAEASTTAAGLRSAGGGLANFGANAAMASISYGLNAMSTSKAHDRQKNMITRGPTYMMEGLRAAGINPILAAGSSGLAGSAAKAPQAGSASVSGINATQAALNVASARKLDAERDIIIAGQPAADWNAAFNLTGTGKTVLQMDRINRALPDSLGGLGAKGIWNLFNNNTFDEDSGKWPQMIGPRPPRGETTSQKVWQRMQELHRRQK